jgi:hypothetical protein
MNLQLDESNNETQILASALRCYLRHLSKEAGSGGWPEINEEIDIVRKLIQEVAK